MFSSSPKRILPSVPASLPPRFRAANPPRTPSRSSPRRPQPTTAKRLQILRPFSPPSCLQREKTAESPALLAPFPMARHEHNLHFLVRVSYAHDPFFDFSSAQTSKHKTSRDSFARPYPHSFLTPGSKPAVNFPRLASPPPVPAFLPSATAYPKTRQTPPRSPPRPFPSAPHPKAVRQKRFPNAVFPVARVPQAAYTARSRKAPGRAVYAVLSFIQKGPCKRVPVLRPSRTPARGRRECRPRPRDPRRTAPSPPRCPQRRAARR